MHSNGLLPTTLLGVAAWLGALQPDLIASLIHANALTFASSAAATELRSDAIRAAVTAALLDRAANGRIETDWSIDLALLVHTSLESQLEQNLEALQRPQQLWWIARLAAAGQCTGLAAALGDAAADIQWYPYARRAAVIAVGELGDDDIVTGLAKILDQDQDPDHQVRAAVIDVLYPRFLSTPALVAALRPQSSDVAGFYHYYDRTLGELADRISLSDLPMALDWLGQLEDGTTARHYGRLVEGLLRRAWDNSDDTAVRQSLARLLVVANRRLLPLNRHNLPWTDGETARRRALVLEMAAIQADSWLSIILNRMLRSPDVEWILDEVDTCPPTTAASLVECIPRIPLGEVTAALADRVLSLPPDHPAHDATRSMRGSVDMSSEVAQIEHEHAVALHEVVREHAQLQEQAKLDLSNALTNVDMDPGSWWQIPMLIKITMEGDPAPPGKHDLTSWPGWSELQPEDAARVIDAGIRYLEEHTPNPAMWTPLNSWTSDKVMPDWTGVYLLTTLVQHHPDKLAVLQLDVWRRWMSAIIAVPVFSGDDPDGLRGLLLDAVPAELSPVLADQAMNHLEVLHNAGQHLSPTGIYRYLVPKLVDRLVIWLIAVPETSPAAAELLSLVARSGLRDTALDLCHRLRGEPGSPLAARAEELLPGLDPNLAVDELTRTDHTPSQIATVTSRINPAELDNAHVLSAVRLLLDAFPYDDDPPLKGGFVTAEDTARRLRSSLLQQLASAGRVDDLSALLVNREGLDQQVLGGHLATAQARQADLALRTIRPQSLLDLLRSADARLVRDDADFLNVLLHQLDNLQHHLTHSTAFREIWDGKTPQSEDSITDWVQRRLEERVSQGIVVDREIQVKREKPKGVGTRIDCVATTVTETRSTARVLFEAKLANNSEVLTAMREQLIERYLIPQGRRHGVLLIYWIHPDRRPAGRTWPKNFLPDKDTLQATLQGQADAELEDGFRIAPVILDITPPEGFAGKDNSTAQPDTSAR